MAELHYADKLLARRAVARYVPVRYFSVRYWPIFGEKAVTMSFSAVLQLFRVVECDLKALHVHWCARKALGKESVQLVFFNLFFKSKHSLINKTVQYSEACV
jgi:hypothetical protein